MRVAVYGICKDEERNAQRWAMTAAAADARILLDTGSQDRTVSVLRDIGVEVYERTIQPWRFDAARNAALDLVPQDIDVCVSLDMDETLSPGWRQALERNWKPGLSRLRYLVIREWMADGKPERGNVGFKIHARHAFRWKFAIHEILEAQGELSEAWTDEIVISHYPDPHKRRNYLALLRGFQNNEPSEPRYVYSLVQELIRDNQYEEALRWCLRFSDMEPAGPFRAMISRYQAWCAKSLGYPMEVTLGLLRQAALLAPYEREHWGNLAIASAEHGAWGDAYAYSCKALEQNDKARSLIIDFEQWGDLLVRLREDSAMNLGMR